MKTRESGMPDESMWTDFFDAETVLRKLGLTSSCGDVVDFGCGYGTFTIPAARMIGRSKQVVDCSTLESSTSRPIITAWFFNGRSIKEKFTDDVLIKLNQITSVIWIWLHRRAGPRRTAIEMRT